MPYGNTIKIVTFKLLTERIRQYINVDEFDCGNQRVNKYLKEDILDDVFHNTFVYIDAIKKRIIAFVTLSCSSIETCLENQIIEFVEKVSAVEIKYFAISKEYQHMVYQPSSKDKLSDIIFDDIIENIRTLTNKYIRAGKIVLSSNISATSFFKKHGFKEFSDMIIISSIDKGTPMFFDLFIEKE